MGKLTTHVIDTANGRPGAGMKVELSVYEGAAWKRLKSVTTNKDGRTDEPLVDGALKPGQYRLKFYVGEYFNKKDFLDMVPVRFNITDANAHYHVPLLCSPWSYATYRGS
ncbi:MAG TPA: hydroxyisourate hydrolase [Burkholderiales bacterium]